MGKSYDWTGRSIPRYVWGDDIWYNESDRRTYKADVERLLWVSEDGSMIPFPKECRLMGKRKNRDL